MDTNFGDRRNNGNRRNDGKNVRNDKRNHQRNSRTNKDNEEQRNVVNKLLEELNDTFVKGVDISKEKLDDDVTGKSESVIEFDSSKLN